MTVVTGMGPGGPQGEFGRPPSQFKTMLGVARPGIAPINPGMPKEAPEPIPEPPPVWQAAPPPEWNAPPAEIPGLPRKRNVPWLAVLVIVGAATLATAVVVAALLYRARGAVETRLLADENGRDRLEITCAGCVDGANVKLGRAASTFKARRASLTLDKALEVGDQRLTLELERAVGRWDKIEVTVPVDFRIRPDTSKLDQTPPRVEARVAARPGSAVVVDGRPLALGPDGRGTAPIDVDKALTGPDPGTKTLERRIPYVVTPPGGTPQNGEVVVRVGIAPLMVQAPGPSLVVDGPSFVLAGRTAKNAVVTVEGRPITVDPSGSFAQMMSVSSAGETNIVVRASVPDLAPRLVVLKIRRVANLVTESALFRARATTSYAAIASDPEGQKGLSVALDGSVVEARADSYTTVLVMDVKSGCASAPCLARISWGSKATLAEGDPVSVFGSLVGSVEGPGAGTRIPAVSAEFLIKGRK